MSTVRAPATNSATGRDAVVDIPLQPASYDIWDKKYRLKAKSGEPVDGTRAWQLGLASRIAPSADLIALALATAAAIASNAPGAVQDSLRMARLALARGEEAAWNATPQVEAERLRSSEVDEGIRAFREKRPPSWQGT